jgi:hypothetical protein
MSRRSRSLVYKRRPLRNSGRNAAENTSAPTCKAVDILSLGRLKDHVWIGHLAPNGLTFMYVCVFLPSNLARGGPEDVETAAYTLRWRTSPADLSNQPSVLGRLCCVGRPYRSVLHLSIPQQQPIKRDGWRMQEKTTGRVHRQVFGTV